MGTWIRENLGITSNCIFFLVFEQAGFQYYAFRGQRVLTQWVEDEEEFKLEQYCLQVFFISIYIVATGYQ